MYNMIKPKTIIKALTLPQKIIFSAFIFLIIPAIIVFSILFNIYLGDKKDTELKLLKMIDEQAMENLDAYITDIKNLTLQPLYDSKDIAHSLNKNDMDILSLLKGDFEGINDSGSAKPDEHGRIITDIQAYLLRSINRIMSVKKEINGVFITNMDGKVFAYNIKDNSLYESGYDPTSEEWFKICEANKHEVAILKSTKYTAVAQPVKNSYVFPIARGIVDINTGECVGVICIYSDINLLRNISRNIMSSENDRLLIINSKDDIIYDTKEENIMKSIKDTSFDIKIFEEDHKIAENNTYIINCTESAMTDWKIVRITPQEELYGGIRELQYKLILLFVAFILLSIALSVLLVYRTMNPLKRLIKTMNVIEKGDLSVRFKVSSNDEIGKLGRNFNSMIDNIDNLINTVYIAELRKKEAKFSALQAQINPHFIYNTLESIRMMAELNDDYKTAEMTLLLGKLLRYSISNINEKVIVNDDIKYLSYYMKLQNYRFNDKFELSLDIDERICTAFIFKLMFQPIVENAIYHGLANIQDKGYISIIGYINEKGICFEVKDNGIGMTEEQLDALNSRINDFEIIETNSIGLKNINERIKINYGEAYGLMVNSEINEGTTVIIEIPNIENLN